MVKSDQLLPFLGINHDLPFPLFEFPLSSWALFETPPVPAGWLFFNSGMELNISINFTFIFSVGLQHHGQLKAMLIAVTTVCGTPG